MHIRPIRTKSDHRAALKEIETLMSARANTPEGERLDVLVTLVDAYERKHFPLDLPDSVEAIKFRMEQLNLTPADRPHDRSPEPRLRDTQPQTAAHAHDDPAVT